MHGPVDGEVSRASRQLYHGEWAPTDLYVKIFAYASALNPTSSARPTRSVGARSPPVGPSRSWSSSAFGGRDTVRSTRTAFLPLATQTSSTSFVTPSAASPVIGDFRESTCSTTLTFLFARNSCARAQEVQPLR